MTCSELLQRVEHSLLRQGNMIYVFVGNVKKLGVSFIVKNLYCAGKTIGLKLLS